MIKPPPSWTDLPPMLLKLWLQQLDFVHNFLIWAFNNQIPSTPEELAEAKVELINRILKGFVPSDIRTHLDYRYGQVTPHALSGWVDHLIDQTHDSLCTLENFRDNNQAHE
jgi:hypothetical protein